MFERVVAAIDGDPERSTRVLDAAAELGRGLGSHVLVVHVRELERPAPMIASTARPGVLPPAVHLESEEEARRLVDAGVERLRSDGVDAEGRLGPGEGSTAREVLDLAQSSGCSVILVGDRGSRVTDLLLGSVAHRIVHLAPCPVLVVR